MAKNLESLNIKLTADNKRLRAALNDSQKKTKASVSVMRRSLRSLRSAFRPAALGVAAIGTALAGLGVTLTRSISQVDALAKRISSTSFSPERFQELDFVLQQMGASAEGAGRILLQLDRRIALLRQGTGELLTVLRGTNEALIDQLAATQSTDEAFEVLRAELIDMEDASQRVAIATQLVGNRLAGALLRALTATDREMEDLVRQAQDLGLVLDRDTLESAEKVTDQLSVLSKVISARLLPVAVRILKPLAAFAEENAKLVGDKIVSGIEAMASAFESIKNFLEGMDLRKLEALAAIGGGTLLGRSALSSAAGLGVAAAGQGVTAGAAAGAGAGLVARGVIDRTTAAKIRQAIIPADELPPELVARDRATIRRNSGIGNSLRNLGLSIREMGANLRETFPRFTAFAGAILALSRSLGVTALAVGSLATITGLLNPLIEAIGNRFGIVDLKITDLIPSLDKFLDFLTALLSIPEALTAGAEGFVASIKLSIAETTFFIADKFEDLRIAIAETFNSFVDGLPPFIAPNRIPVPPRADRSTQRDALLNGLRSDVKENAKVIDQAFQNFADLFSSDTAGPAETPAPSSQIPGRLFATPNPLSFGGGGGTGGGGSNLSASRQSALDSLSSLQITIDEQGLSDTERRLREIERERIAAINEAKRGELELNRVREVGGRANADLLNQFIELQDARFGASDEDKEKIDAQLESLNNTLNTNEALLAAEERRLTLAIEEGVQLANTEAAAERRLALEQERIANRQTVDELIAKESDALAEQVQFLEDQRDLAFSNRESAERILKIDQQIASTKRELNTQLIEEQKNLAGIEGVVGGLKSEFADFTLTAGELGQEIAQDLTRGIASFGDQFIQAMARGQSATDALKNSVRQLGLELAQSLTRAALQTALFGGGGAGGEGAAGATGGIVGGIFSAFSGGRASGGPIAPGKFAVVGEEGPELAFGGTRGLNIVPNSGALPSSAINRVSARNQTQIVVNNINQSSRSEVETTQQRGSDGRVEITNIVRDVFTKDLRTNGPMARAITSSTSARRRTG